MLRVAVPNKGALSESAAEILVRGRATAGAPTRKDLTVIDPANGVEFFFLRPKDIAIYVGSGELDFGITGRDLAAESERPGARAAGAGLRVLELPLRRPGRPGLDRRRSRRQANRHGVPEPGAKRPADKGIDATVIRLDGAVEISIQLGVADAIADVVGSGRTLSLHNLVAFGDPLCDSEAVLIERDADDGARRPTGRHATNSPARVQGVVFGQQYLMLDYDCPRSVLRRARPRSPRAWSRRPSPRWPTRTGWRCARWCRAARSTRSWTSSPPSAPRRSWPPTSGSAASELADSRASVRM